MTHLDRLFLATARVSTFEGQRGLTNASGFFFERDEKLYLVTSRHVVIEESSKHYPDRLEIELHLDETNLTLSTGFSLLLYRDAKAVWRQGKDASGEIDVAVLELDRSALPKGAVFAAFTPAHLQQAADDVPIGEPLFVIGFPLGFHDAVHHLPVIRGGMMASPFGIRFQGQGFFLTDARTHRGTSGAPVVIRGPAQPGQPKALTWKLVGVHSSRMDMGDRDLVLDESLGLNCAWYADILMTLTGPVPVAAVEATATK